MRIQSIQFNFCGVKPLSALKQVSNPINLPATEGGDVFVKSKDMANISTKEGLEKLYDEVYDRVTEQNIEANPILKEVKINKPKFIYDENNDGTTIADYSIDSNTVTLYGKSIKQELYVGGSFDENGFFKKLLRYVIYEDELEKDTKRFAPHIDGFRVEKLTQQEKALFVEAAIAHELRHCIQEHLMLSCKTSSAITKKNFKQQLRHFNFIKKEFEKRGTNLSDIDVGNYPLKYRPKKYLSDSTTLEKSIFEGDDKAWSVVEDFAKTEAKFDIYEKLDERYYYLNPLEVDAHSYQSEYLYTRIPELHLSAQREDILYHIADSYKYAVGIEQ